jgi:hypothetical protein
MEVASSICGTLVAKKVNHFTPLGMSLYVDCSIDLRTCQRSHSTLLLGERRKLAQKTSTARGKPAGSFTGHCAMISILFHFPSPPPSTSKSDCNHGDCTMPRHFLVPENFRAARRCAITQRVMDSGATPALVIPIPHFISICVSLTGQ